MQNNDTDYIGEWNTTKAEANEELRYITKGGKSKVGGIKRSTRKVFKKNTSVLSGTHNDTKSHNYKISISGINTKRNLLMNDLRGRYGYLSSWLLTAKKGEKNQITKEMREIRAEIMKLKKHTK